MATTLVFAGQGHSVRIKTAPTATGRVTVLTSDKTRTITLKDQTAVKSAA